MNKPLCTGPCRGGPMDGKEGQSRFPKGFLLVDRPAGQAWIYEWIVETSEFQVRNDSPMPLDEEGRRKAAEGIGYDVRVVDQ